MRTTLLSSLTLFVLACGGPERPDNQPPPLLTIEKSSALDAANQNFRSVVVGAARSGGFAEDSALLDLLPFGSDATAPCDPNTGCPEAPTMEAQANDMADDLAARILSVANVEIEEPTRIVLVMKPSVYCSSTSSTTQEQSCVQSLTMVPIRLELTSHRANDIDAALSVGPYSVASIQFYRDRFAVELDFGAVIDAAKALADAGGEPMEAIEGSIRGRVRLELLVNGNNDYTLSLSIIAPIVIDAAIEGETLSVNIGTSTPLASLRIDGATPKLVVESNVGAIDMTIPLGLFQSDSAEPGQEVTGILGIRIEPTSAKLTIDTTETVKLDRYQTGGANITFDGTPMFSYSLNNGQALSGTFTSDELGSTISVTPMLDMRAEMDLSALVQQLESEVPPALLRDSLQLLLNGAPSPTVRTRTIERTTTDPNGGTITEERTAFEVLQGRLSLSSSAAGKTVVVEAGMCLDTIEADPNQMPEPHPFELLVATTCE